MSSSLEQTFEHSMPLLFLCSSVLKTSKHPQNTTSAPDSVIPGLDQGSYPNDGTNAGDKKSTSYTPQHQIPGPCQE